MKKERQIIGMIHNESEILSDRPLRLFEVFVDTFSREVKKSECPEKRWRAQYKNAFSLKVQAICQIFCQISDFNIYGGGLGNEGPSPKPQAPSPPFLLHDASVTDGWQRHFASSSFDVDIMNVEWPQLSCFFLSTVDDDWWFTFFRSFVQNILSSM